MKKDILLKGMILAEFFLMGIGALMVSGFFLGFTGFSVYSNDSSISFSIDLILILIILLFIIIIYFLYKKLRKSSNKSLKVRKSSINNKKRIR